MGRRARDESFRAFRVRATRPAFEEMRFSAQTFYAPIQLPLVCRRFLPPTLHPLANAIAVPLVSGFASTCRGMDYRLHGAQDSRT